jgi:hypothetical protein
MRPLFSVLLMVLLAVASSGCGGDRERGKNREKDIKPREPLPTTADKR